MKKGSLVNKILGMVSLTAVIVCVAVTIVGSLLIYFSSVQTIKSEIEQSANTLFNIYELKYDGDYHIKDNHLKKGTQNLSAEEFKAFSDAVECSDDVDFTLFWQDTRIFTSVTNNDGSLAVGTKASSTVVEEVLDKGVEYYNRHVRVNGELYIGYYIPIINSNAETVGMMFAGKPLGIAVRNVIQMISSFLAISVLILFASYLICLRYSHSIVNSLSDIRNYTIKLSEGDFSYELKGQTLLRKDEIGDIARSAQQLSANLRELIECDPLTSLLNRRSCRKLLDNLVKQGTSLTVVMGDIDYFKKINDSYGHSAGDMVLKELSAMLSAHVKKHNGYAARWGGEEFLLVYPRSDYEDVFSELKSLVEEIQNKSFTFNEKNIAVTMTMGVSQHDFQQTIDETINRADKLLYIGKQQGRNRIIKQ